MKYFCSNFILTLFLSLGLSIVPSHADEDDEKEAKLMAQKLALIEYLKPLADAGEAEAQFQLASTYLDKPFEDEETAVLWLDKAVAQGHCEAIVHKGYIIQTGYKSFKKDKKKGLEIFRQGADAGCIRAQTMVGHAYRGGNGVKRNREESAVWYKKAAEQGEYIAAYRLGVQYNMGRGVKKDRMESLYWLSLAVAGDVEGRSRARAIDLARKVKRKLDDDEVALVMERVNAWKQQQVVKWEEAVAE